IVGAPGNIVNVPVDVSKAMRPSSNGALNLGVTSGSAFRGLNFGNIMPKIGLGSLPGPIPQVSMLPQKQNAFQPTPPKGLNLFDKAPKDPRKNAAGALGIR